MVVEHIEQRDGGYCITGTKISLVSIVYMYRDGYTVEAIRDNYPSLSWAQIFGAISYYLDNQPAIDAYVLRDEEAWRDLERQATPMKAELLARLAKAKAG